MRLYYESIAYVSMGIESTQPACADATRVLLVDDHASVREGLRHIVDAQPDMTVIGEAASGEEALVQNRQLQPDVLVLDLTMPGMGGLLAARRLKQEDKQPALVVLTRHDDPAFVQRLLEIGVAAYVLKQSRSSELLRAIRAAASGDQYLDPALARPTQFPHDSPIITRISQRETEVMRLVATGHSNKEIASALDIAVKTVEVHKANAMRKLGLRGRIDVVKYAVLNGWYGDV